MQLKSIVTTDIDSSQQSMQLLYNNYKHVAAVSDTVTGSQFGVVQTISPSQAHRNHHQSTAATAEQEVAVAGSPDATSPTK